MRYRGPRLRRICRRPSAASLEQYAAGIRKRLPVTMTETPILRPDGSQAGVSWSTSPVDEDQLRRMFEANGGQAAYNRLYKMIGLVPSESPPPTMADLMHALRKLDIHRPSLVTTLAMGTGAEATLRGSCGPTVPDKGDLLGGIKVVLNRSLASDQWVALDHRGDIVAAGRI